ncbi:Uncharacterized protein C22G7.07c [Erysiphe neolycopersici]|uniref:Uncharacterized protein C22G7.07c n=1 Tax=Erysiphe neolycopersici TaxID=212602 RepID=A0A420HJK6_9PEZI|nr:Uncharacterized protein C22G7.07c [Erysiphe neolycopersici]
MESHILYQNPTSTVLLVDIPRSIEVAQGFQLSSSLRLVSTKPLEIPFPIPEPKSSNARFRVLKKENQTIRDLILEKYLELALEELRQSINRKKWCLERVTEIVIPEEKNSSNERRPSSSPNNDIDEESMPLKRKGLDSKTQNFGQQCSRYYFYQNRESVSTIILHGNRNYYLPPLSTTLIGSIQSTIRIFNEKEKFPQFGIITADPPWPNRSARRNGKYRISNNISEIENLLLTIPVRHLHAANGIMAIWITNKSKIRSLALKLFDQWGLSVMEEWIWLKITVSGEPIFPIASLWRKPYELLLIGRKVATSTLTGSNVKRRVLVGVPDLHSRKPSLKGLLEKEFSFEPGNYTGLEIFARNSTTGWWSLGFEALMFQEMRFWKNSDDKKLEN